MAERNGQEMYQTFKQALVVLCVFMHVSVDGQNCPYKECTCDVPITDCSNLGLTTMPVLLNLDDNYTLLYMDDNSIPAIPAGSMLPNLTTIYFDQNPILTVADTAFDDSASTLQSLSLSSVLFTRVPDAFLHLKALTTFTLGEANITDWNDEAMKNLGQTLVTLSLDKVGLKSWPSWLQYFSRLSELTITKSSISLIPDDALDNAASTLTILTMNNNKLTQVPKAFSKLTSLQELELQKNKIVDVSWLPPSNSLTSLLLNDNLISNANVLSNVTRPYGATLRNFRISNNRLTSVPNVPFLTHFKSLDLSDNRISDLYSGAVGPEVSFIDLKNNFLPAIPRVLTTLQSVYLLSLTVNSIKQIQASDFPITATIIELGSNLITELTDTSFPVNSSINHLDLYENPIATISSGVFSNLAQLEILLLQGTRLTRIPLALSSLSSLSILDLSETPTLVCTCMEKSVGQWLLSKSNMDLSGDCGLLDIKTFFTILSPSCP